MLNENETCQCDICIEKARNEQKEPDHEKVEIPFWLDTYEPELTLVQFP